MQVIDGHLLGFDSVEVIGDFSLQVLDASLDEASEHLIMLALEGLEDEGVHVLLKHILLQHALEVESVGRQLRKPLQDIQALLPSMRSANRLKERFVAIALVPEEFQSILQ
jgi:hypothetical protein